MSTSSNTFSVSTGFPALTLIHPQFHTHYIYSTRTARSIGILTDSKTSQNWTKRIYIKLGQTQQDDVMVRIQQQDGTGVFEPLEKEWHYEMVPVGISDREIRNLLIRELGWVEARIDASREWLICLDCESMEVVIEKVKKIYEKAIKNPELFKEKFTPKTPQKRCFNAIDQYYEKDGGAEFYILMKPRAGKNAASLFSLVDIIYKKYLENSQWEYSVYSPPISYNVLFLSAWPSTFAGLIDHQKKFAGLERINFVDCSRSGWESKLVNNGSKINVLVVSKQSLDFNVKLGPISNPKLKKLMKLTFDIGIFDESDHTLRSENSRRIIGNLTIHRKIWMSGTDVYAMINHAKGNNHCVYTIFDQERLRNTGDPSIVGKVPFTHTLALDLPSSFFRELADAESRRMRIIYSVKKDEMQQDIDEESIKEENEKISVQVKRDGQRYWRYSDKGNLGKLIELEYPNVVKAIWELIVRGQTELNLQSFSPFFGLNALNHGICFMPSVLSMYALENLLRRHFPRFLEICDFVILNELGSAYSLEATINHHIIPHAQLEGRRTLCLTVGKLCRGATVPAWQFVMKMTDTVDWKGEHQKDLRAESGDHPYAWVYDYNPLRCIQVRIDNILFNAKHIEKDKRSTQEILREHLKLHPVMMITDQGEMVRQDDEKIYRFLEKNLRIKSLTSPSMVDDLAIENLKGVLSNLLKNVPRGSSKDRIIVKQPKNPKDKLGRALGRMLNQARKVGKNAGKSDIVIIKEKICSISAALPWLVLITDFKVMTLSKIINMKTFTKSELQMLWYWAHKFCGLGGWGEFKALYETGIFTISCDMNLIAICNEVKENGIESFADFLYSNKQLTEATGFQITPNTIVKGVLSQYSDNQWENRDATWCDPTCGSGTFLIAIKKKLLDLKFDEKHILEQMIYGYDVNPLLVKLTKLRLDPTQIAQSLNIEKRDILNPLLKIQGPPMKLKHTNVLGNPPYNLGSTDGPQRWTDFVNAAIDVFLDPNNGYMSYVVPYQLERSSHGKIPQCRDKMVQSGLISITNNKDIVDEQDPAIFKETVTFSIDCTKKGSSPFLSNTPLFSQDTLDIISKIQQKGAPFGFLVFKNPKKPVLVAGSARKFNGHNGNSPVFLNEGKKDTNAKNNVNLYRIVVPYVNGGTPTWFEKAVVVNPGDYFSQSYRYFSCKTKHEADNLTRYLQTDFVKFLLENTVSSRSVDGPQTYYIPELNFTQSWDNESLLTFFNITEPNLIEAINGKVNDEKQD